MINIPKDKYYHFIAGLIIGGIGTLLLPLIWAIGLSVLIAIGKEGYDYWVVRHYGLNHSVEVLDIFATLLGSAVGIGFVWWTIL